MKIVLKEDLFDGIDDIVIMPKENTDDTPSGPPVGVETTIANELIDNINGEWDTITNYNNVIVDLRQAGLDDFIPVIEDINNEEHKHIGQLQEILKKISPNTNSIASGEIEGAEQLTESYIQEKEINRQAKDIKDYIRDFVQNIAIKYPQQLYKIKNRAFEFSSYIDDFVNGLEE